MQAANNLYEAGLQGYGNALYAIGHFERIVIETVSRVLNSERQNCIARSFGVPKIHDSGVIYLRPKIHEMLGVTRDNLWAKIGKEYWIPQPHYSNIFFGFEISMGEPYATIMFRKNNAGFRERLHRFLTLSKIDYDPEYSQTIISKGLDATHSIEEFGSILDKMLLNLLQELKANPVFKDLSEEEGE